MNKWRNKVRDYKNLIDRLVEFCTYYGIILNEYELEKERNVFTLYLMNFDDISYSAFLSVEEEFKKYVFKDYFKILNFENDTGYDYIDVCITFVLLKNIY